MKQHIISSILLSFLFFTACKNKQENHNTASADSYYTCPMHPSVMSSTPGSCPVCNMSLIKVEQKENKHEGHEGNYITIDKHAQELSAIETDTVKYRNILPASTIFGTVAIDEEKVQTISSRAKGRIDKLFVKTTGIYVKNGSPLYSIYSEQLFADEKEYLALLGKLKTANSTAQLTNDFLNAAKNKLQLWGLTTNQIAELETSGTANPLITFFSNETGYVSAVKITEGMYVEEGSPILTLTSLNQVWVEAQVYANEISKATENKSFQVFPEDNPNDIYKGTLIYNNPVIEAGKRIHLLRISVDNSKGRLIPGMMVSVNPQKAVLPVLAVPKSAVLLEKMTTVWVMKDDTTFEQRMVKTGVQNKYWFEIVSGLQRGDVVVTNGAYLINSAFILKSGAGQRHGH